MSDSVLIDLLATALREDGAPVGCSDLAAYLEAVVEQHINGRIAETVKSTGQRMYAQTKKWQERAENAEATIVRMQALADDLELRADAIGRANPHHTLYISLHRQHVAMIRAAVEGEQQ
ncbi:hypothetical protein QM716_11915 [Rhodococcus sp. IEGM 1409]|uniref:hypothetical protein n=1 Tax=Rhodococcus sp. IEGM 1409 TaxID=3047082 RepID=UPI0024B740BE|nr:hypothetical protein [Rhodococcus sp. IEGM 1409]MDI9900558.1 hypothetical protein [Rhodococcus sp. IEGM 1409]